MQFSKCSVILNKQTHFWCQHTYDGLQKYNNANFIDLMKILKVFL